MILKKVRPFLSVAKGVGADMVVPALSNSFYGAARASNGLKWVNKDTQNWAAQLVFDGIP